MKDSDIIELLRIEKYRQAGEKLYKYFPVVKKLVLKNNGSKQDAEDIYQEALIILIKKVQTHDFVLTSSLNTYLYSVCRFLWNDALKKKSKSITVDLKDHVPSDSGEIVQFLEVDRNIRLAEQAFLQLGEKCRQLLQLFYFKKMSMREISTRLKFSSEKIAKNQKYRCLDKAKENLKTLKLSGHE